jgi:hypothetical protein
MNISKLKDYEEILEVLNVYVEGGNVSGEMTKTAFHPNATVNAAPAQGLFDAIDKAGKGESVARVDILDVVGNIASARVVMENWHGQNFVDFHHLLKINDGWKIVSKIFQAY